jgi:hypothetical protein
MMPAALPLIAVTGVILNDIGLVLEPAGLMQIKSSKSSWCPTRVTRRFWLRLR